MSFFLPWENWEKSHRFVCRFFLPSENWEKSHRFVCRFFAVGKLGKKS